MKWGLKKMTYAEQLYQARQERLARLGMIPGKLPPQPPPPPPEPVIEIIEEEVKQYEPVRFITVKTIIRTVAKHFGLTPQQIISHCRAKDLLIPRHITAFLANRLTRHSNVTIGMYMGCRDHTTILNSIRRIQMYMATDEELRQTINNLEAELMR